MRFVSAGVCVMRSCGPMRYAVQFPAHRLGGRLELCVIRGYALSEVCVKRGSTVAINTTFLSFPNASPNFPNANFFHRIFPLQNSWSENRYRIQT